MKVKAQIKDLEFFFSAIQAVNDEEFRKQNKLKEGDYFELDVWKERNVDFHKKYFKFLATVINHMPEKPEFDKFRNIDSLRKELMYQNGRFNIHETLGGKANYEAHSISFKSMDNETFEKIYKEATDTCLKYFLNHLTLEEFKENILNFI